MPLPAIVPDAAGRLRALSPDRRAAGLLARPQRRLRPRQRGPHAYMEVEGARHRPGPLRAGRGDASSSATTCCGRWCCRTASAASWPSVPEYRIEVLDLRGQTPAEAEAASPRSASEMSHQVLAGDRWPLFDIRATLPRREPGPPPHQPRPADRQMPGAVRHAPARAGRAVPRTPDRELLASRAVVPRLRAGREPGCSAPGSPPALASYWRARLADLPPAPELPLAASPVALEKPRFVRRSRRGSPPEAWTRLKERAARAGLTPSALLLAAFARGPGGVEQEPALHPQPHPVQSSAAPSAGQPGGGGLHLADPAGGRRAAAGGFEERARRLQEQLWEDLDHRTSAACGCCASWRGCGGGRRAPCRWSSPARCRRGRRRLRRPASVSRWAPSWSSVSRRRRRSGWTTRCRERGSAFHLGRGGGALPGGSAGRRCSRPTWSCWSAWRRRRRPGASRRRLVPAGGAGACCAAVNATAAPVPAGSAPRTVPGAGAAAPERLAVVSRSRRAELRGAGRRSACAGAAAAAAGGGARALWWRW